MVPRRFVCSLCPAVFPAHDQLEAHVKLHQTKYKCQYCTAAFCKVINKLSLSQKGIDKYLFSEDEFNSRFNIRYLRSHLCLIFADLSALSPF